MINWIKKTWTKISIVLAIVVFGTLAFFNLNPTLPMGAFPGDYTKHQEVVIDHTKVDADLTDYPIYVDLSDLDKTTDIFDTCREDGGDIRVTKADGTTQLPREVVAIDTTAKTGELHVKYTGTLSSTVDTTIRIWYNGSDTEPAADSTYGSQNAWNSNFKMVQHMKDETTSTIKDSTVNANDGTKLGANEPIEADGKIAKAQDFDGVDDDVNCGTLGGMTTQEPWTISVWVNKTQEDRWEHFWVKYSMNIGTHSAYDPDRLFIEWRDEISDLHQVHIGVAPTQNQFVHLVMSYDGGLESDRIKVFLDGSMPWTSGDILGGIKDASLYDFKIGGNRKFEGIIDEVRISNTARSTGWISTEYANQNSPSTFYEVSEEGGFAVGTNMQVNISDVWKDIPLIKININDVWKDVEGAQENVGDVWKTIF